MAKKIILKAEKREDVGKGASRRLRRIADKVPAIVYGAKKEPVSITLQHNKVLHTLEEPGVFSQIVNLEIEGKSEPVVIKDLQRHPFKPKIQHIDFLRIKADKPITMLISLEFIGEDIAPGVKMDGGVTSHDMKEVEVVCLPADLPENIEVDVSNLGLNEDIRLSDLVLPKNVKLSTDLTDPENNHKVIGIQLPRRAETKAESETEEAEEAETEESATAEEAGKE